MQLYNHQEKFLAKNPSKTLLCWDTGTGKTRTAIEWAMLNSKKSPYFLPVVICPKALKENWRRQISMWWGDGKMVVMSKEEFSRHWDQLQKYTALIVDEAHFFAGPKSGMSKNMLKYCKKHSVSHMLLMTATPYLSTPWNIYVLAKHLGHDWNWLKFRQTFFQDRYIGHRVVPEPKEGIQDEIAGLVRKIGDVVRLDECADVPDQIFELELFEMTTEQQERRVLILETNPIVRFTKYHQLENGTLKGDEFNEDEMIPNMKLDRIVDLAMTTKKIAIVCRYNLQVKKIYDTLLEKGKTVYMITGEVKDRDSVVRDVESSEDCAVIINASCSEGYELPSVGVCVFASLSFSYKDYKQMLGRFLRINKLKTNVYIHMVVEKGVDKAVYDSIMRKQDFDIAIYSETLDALGE